MPHIRFPHSVIVKSPGLLPMLYKVSELAQSLSVPDRTLRDWLVAGAPHFRDHRNNLWINGREFADWVVNFRKKQRRQKLRQGEAFCLRCNQPVKMTEVSTQVKQGKLVMIRGKCPVCGCQICRGDRVPTYPSGNLIHREVFNES